MVKYYVVFVFHFFCFFPPAFGSHSLDDIKDQGIKTKSSHLSSYQESEHIIEELLSKKFDYFGENLNDEIQKIRESSSFKKLTLIKENLEEISKNHGVSKEKKTEVSIFVKKQDDERDNTESFKRALLAAAYFPEELDPKTKRLPLADFARFKFIHRQLADSLFYGHPLANKYFKQVSAICNVPLDDDSHFYKDFYSKPGLQLDDYKQYVFPLGFYGNKGGFEESTEEDVDPNKDESDINQKVTIPSYSKEIADYFQTVVDENPEHRVISKRRRLLKTINSKD